MSPMISSISQKKIEIFLRNILESFNLKFPIYKMVIVPSQMIAQHRLKKIVRNSSQIKKGKSGKKIIFTSVDARFTPHTYLEGGIAKSLQIRGHQVKMIICGGMMETCAGHFTVKKPRNAWQCKNCIKYSTRFYEITGLPYSAYCNYISQKELTDIKNKVNKIPFSDCGSFVYKNVNVGYHAAASADRYFLGEPTPKEIYEPMLRSELTNAIISTDIAEKIINEEKPDVLVTSHGCYSTWGSFADYFINRGIKTRVWTSGYKSDTMTFDINKIEEYFKEYYEKVRKKKPLNKEETQELNAFLNKRVKGEEGDTALYGFSKRGSDLEKEFNFSKYDKNYVMFPNIAWDFTLLQDKAKAFQDIYDWVSSTIELFKQKEKDQLIIKIHPAEKTSGSEKTMKDYINEKFSHLPENVKIIPPDTTISAYSLFPYINVGLMYSGTLCLEMALNNIPVIMVGESRYSNKGFTYYAATKEEYLALLEKESLSVGKDALEMAKIYGYFYFIKNYIPRKFTYFNSFLDLGWKIKSFDDLGPGKDKYLDHICKYIVSGGVLQDW